MRPERHRERMLSRPGAGTRAPASRPAGGELRPIVAAVSILLGAAVTNGGAAAQVVSFERSSYEVGEGAGRLDYCLVRSGDLTARSDAIVSVRFGSASLQDFALSGVNFPFFPGDTRQCGGVFIFDDDRPEEDESFELFIDKVFAPGSIGEPAQATVTIVDDDAEVEVRFPGVAAEDGTVNFFQNACFTSMSLSLSRPADEAVIAELLISPGAREFFGISPGKTLARQLFDCETNPLPVSLTIDRAGFGTVGNLTQLISVGIPNRAQVFDCRFQFLGSPIPCREGSCVWSIFTQLLPCVLRGECPTPAPAATTVRPASSISESATRTLLDVREDVMSTSRAGRFYRDLYSVFSPALIESMLEDPLLVHDLIVAYPPWIERLQALVDSRGGSALVTGDMVDDMVGLFDRLEQGASPRLAAVFRRERQRLRVEDFAGRSVDEMVALVEERGGPQRCENGKASLCLQDGRFRVDVFWRDFDGRVGDGRAVPLSRDSGYFWFFGPENVELVVKVLDGRPVNDRYWVFYGALSNVEYAITVTDTLTGAVRSYENPPGEFASVGDTEAFDPAGGPRAGRSGSGFVDPLESPVAAVGSAVGRLVGGGLRRLNDSFRLSRSARLHRQLRAAAGPQQFEVGGATACAPSPTVLCLREGRFEVEVSWRDFDGRTGVGQPGGLTDEVGTFWFFDPDNTELIVKVLDGRLVNGHFWVFYGALSNVEYTIRVTDTTTGAVAIYVNPAGEFGSRGDAEAF